MKKRKKVLLYPAAALSALFLFIALEYILTGDPAAVSAGDAAGGAVEIVAHRGVHHNYQKGVYDPVSGCEAIHIFPPAHDILENTIESIDTAFASGATLVEIDIR